MIKVAKMPANYSEIFNANIISDNDESTNFGLFFLSLAVTTFYRKSFTFKNQGSFVLVMYVGFFIWRWNSFGLPHLSSFVVLTYKLFIILFTINELRNDIKTLDLQDLFNVSVMEIFLQYLSVGNFTSIDLWKTILMMSPLQLVRKPVFLKDLLRPIRVSAGPVSIILSICAGTLQIFESTERITVEWKIVPFLIIFCSILTIISAVLAGVVFRPDNTEVLKLVHPNPIKYPRRVEIHATANGVILIISLGIVLSSGI